jgi:hypothetical protein
MFRVLLFTAAVGVYGQQALKDALGLTEMQIWQLQQEKKPIAVVPSGIASAARRSGDFALPRPYKESLSEALHNPILDASQQAKLAEIVKVMDRWRAASEAIAMGLIRAEQWPGDSACLPYPIRAFPSEFDISDAQLEQLERLQQATQEPLWVQIRAKDMARSALLDSKSPAAAQLSADIHRLSQQLAATRPPRDLTLAILSDAQKAKIAAFEADSKLTREAIELKLIPTPVYGEPLCQ